MKTNLIMWAIAATSLLSGATAYAEEASEVSIGMIYVNSASVYSNAKSTSAVFPSISYESDTLSVSVRNGLAYKFINGERAEISFSVAPTFSPYESSDSPDLTGMTRPLYFDGSVNASYKLSRSVTAKAKFATELTNEFNGHSADLAISKFILIFGQPLIFDAGAKWLDAKKANYLYGVNASDVIDSRAEYAPGSATLPYLSVYTFHPLTKQTSVFAYVGADFLPSNLVKSPIVSRKRSVISVLGINYSF